MRVQLHARLSGRRCGSVYGSTPVLEEVSTERRLETEPLGDPWPR
jgi:hypothetical protein